MADFSINLDGLTVDLAVNGNVFDVLSIVSQHLRQQAVPRELHRGHVQHGPVELKLHRGNDADMGYH